MENENKLNYTMKRYRDKLKKHKKENNIYNQKDTKDKKTGQINKDKITRLS